MFYLDSSAWVKRYEREDGTDWVERLWTQVDLLGSSRLALVEVVSAVARRHRERAGDGEVVRQTLQAVQADFRDMLCVELSEDVLDLAVALAETHRLRGADAVHLASALRLKAITETDLTMVASDGELLATARMEGLPVLDPRLAPPLA